MELTHKKPPDDERQRQSYERRELLYLGLDGRLMSVIVGGMGTIETDVPRALFTIGPQGARYEVSPDGHRFLAAGVALWLARSRC